MSATPQPDAPAPAPEGVQKRAITAKLAEGVGKIARSQTAMLIGEHLYRLALPWKRRATVGYYVTFFWGTLGLAITALVAIGEGGRTAFWAIAAWLAFGFATFAGRYFASRKYQKMTGREWKPPL